MAKNNDKHKKYDEKRAGERTRNWSFIVYPDSAPKNWVEIIQEERVPFVVSPIHDSDVNELTGELKKAHFHVLITYSSVKTFEQVKE
ncbi:MAG: Rep family protein, partial [Waterburya sp.]|uniref:Rep family protein n=1 Tax=Cetobacterium sp. TaxID=2071632 RepID=UPI003F3D8D48